MTFTIALASREDLPALAEVNRSAYSLELPSRFAHKNWADVNYMFNFFKGRLVARFDHVGTQVFKAFDPDNGEIVGFACWTHETASNEVDQTPTGTMIQKMPPTVNVEFMKTVGTEIEQLRGHMKGEEHYYLSAFAVDLSRQNKGIGSQLLKHCLQIADDAALPSWLISFPGSHDLYLRFSFCDVDHRDIDLNAWDKNKMRGYGVYRQYAMVRRLK
ncbi:acyl-CoA N-acyltransferase [Xylaria scruposa]|nr:acyl-CoA N-acyltransferase [Xylaria scruposa]